MVLNGGRYSIFFRNEGRIVGNVTTVHIKVVHAPLILSLSLLLYIWIHWRFICVIDLLLKSATAKMRRWIVTIYRRSPKIKQQNHRSKIDTIPHQSSPFFLHAENEVEYCFLKLPPFGFGVCCSDSDKRSVHDDDDEMQSTRLPSACHHQRLW